jgi:anti-sigma28 factor (negative regulator of flagellin synthesis)
MTHSEPDDPYSRAHDRWAERQKLVERHLGDVEAEIAEMKEAIRNGTYEAE